MSLAVFNPILALNQLSLLAMVAVAGGLYFFVYGFRLLARKRLILNTPTSKIRSASLGLVEVGGVAVGPYTVPAPITGSPSYLYQTTAWRQREEGRNREWTKIAAETLHVPFYLDDGTGQLLIDPTGAELDLHCEFRQTFDQTWISRLPENANAFLNRHGITPDGDHYRIEERIIRPKQSLFVVGTLAENHKVEVHPADVGNGLSAPRYIPPRQSPPAEVVRLSEAAGASSSVDMTQQSRIAAALTKAGITNPKAWAAAGIPYHDAAIHEPPRISQIDVNSAGPSPQPGQAAFYPTPPVALMKGENSPTFLISWRSRRALVGAMAWKSLTMIWGGAGLTLLGVYVLLAQLEIL